MEGDSFLDAEMGLPHTTAGAQKETETNIPLAVVCCECVSPGVLYGIGGKLELSLSGEGGWNV
jgi:hypothetical protein